MKHFFLLRLPYSVTNSLSFSTHARARARVRIDDDSTYTRTQRWRKDDAKSRAAKRSTNPLPSPATLFPHQFPSLPHKRANKESAPIGIFAKRGVERRAARRVPRRKKKRKEKETRETLSFHLDLGQTRSKHLFNLRLPYSPVNSLPLSSRSTSERKRKSARVESSMRHRPTRRCNAR